MLEEGLFHGDLGCAVLALHPFHVDIKAISGLEAIEILQFTAVDEGLGLPSDIQEDAVFVLLGNRAVDDCVSLDALGLNGAALEQFLHRRHVV